MKKITRVQGDQMAIVGIPGIIYLVSHSSGGAMLSTAGGYVAGTLIPASVVASAPAIAIGAVTVTAAVATGYLCLHGVPPAIVEILVSKGAATVVATGKGAVAATAATSAAQAATGVSATAAAPVIAVPVALVAGTLLALAAVGFVAYTQSEEVKKAVDDAYEEFLNAKDDSRSKLDALVLDLKGAFAKALNATKAYASEASAYASTVAMNVASTLDDAYEAAKTGVSAQMVKAKATVSEMAEKVASKTDSTWKEFQQRKSEG